MLPYVLCLLEVVTDINFGLIRTLHIMDHIYGILSSTHAPKHYMELYTVNGQMERLLCADP